MLALYHFGGAICAQKVRLALAEKGVDFESRDCNGPMLRDPEYLKLNPSGVVPTLVHGDLVINESRVISEYINDAFEGPTLMPDDSFERYVARYWSKQIDDSLHINVYILTFLAFAREMFQKLPPSQLATALPGLRDPIKRRVTTDLFEHGWRTPWAAMAVNRFTRLTVEMELVLAEKPYLAGETYSLSDADFTAYINRLGELGLGSLMDDKPALRAWFQRMKARPSFKIAISDWDSDVDAARYASARERFKGELDSLMAGGDGQNESEREPTSLVR